MNKNDFTARRFLILVLRDVIELLLIGGSLREARAKLDAVSRSILCREILSED